MNITNDDSITRRPRRSWLLALPLAVGLAVPAVTAFARTDAAGAGDGMGEHGHFGRGRRMARILDSAGASDAQKAQIKAAWQGLRPQLQAVREQRMKLRGEMKKALTGATIDTAAVERLRQQEVQLADKASTLFTQGMVQTAQVLTPEQRQKVAAQLDQRHGHRD